MVEYYQYKGIYSRVETFYSSGLFTEFIFETILSFIMPYKFLDGFTYQIYNNEVDLSITYTYNEVLTCFLMLRLLSAFQMIFAGVKYNSNKSDRIR